jgi:predicted polyphosphate/ATP-dependent NAD kinase
MDAPPANKITIGLVINPIAGMGGKVALKGTDGMYDEALRRGAQPGAAARAVSVLRRLKDFPLLYLTCSGEMGEDALQESGIHSYRIVYRHRTPSSADDTCRACQEFLNHGASMILFCGGDGTARDVFSIGRDRIPILGIPAGVKMYSAVFGVNPASCAEIISRLDETELRDSEVVDVDEELYRKGVLATRIFGFARVPSLPLRAQMGKQEYTEPDEERAKKAIALFFSEILRNDTLYILGAGTTIAEIACCMGVEKTLLGVDVMKGGNLLAKDADEQTLLSLIKRADRVKIIVSPLGGQGFILGRGTQTLSPEVVRKVGIGNIVVVATPHKLAETRMLYLDTGDESLDRAFGDSVLVISGYRMGIRKRLLHPVLSSQEGQSINPSEMN